MVAAEVTRQDEIRAEHLARYGAPGASPFAVYAADDTRAVVALERLADAGCRIASAAETIARCLLIDAEGAEVAGG